MRKKWAKQMEKMSEKINFLLNFLFIINHFPTTADNYETGYHD